MAFMCHELKSSQSFDDTFGGGSGGFGGIPTWDQLCPVNGRENIEMAGHSRNRRSRSSHCTRVGLRETYQ